MLGPESAHSPNAEDLNALYWVMLVVGGLLVVAVNVALVALAVRFRRARGRRPRRFTSRGRTQLAVASGLGALAAAIFVAGVAFTESASDVEASGAEGLQASSRTTAQVGLDLPAGEAEPLRILASGQQWIWRYEYPDGTFSYYELIVPEDTAVVVEIDSTDVVHRWWVPGLGAKVDAVPGRINRTWFKAEEAGSFEGASYQFSGAGYAYMRTRVRVLGVAEYQQWLEQQAADIAEAQEIVQRQIAAGGAFSRIGEGGEP